MGNRQALPLNEAIYHAAKTGKQDQLNIMLRNVQPGSRPENLLEWQDEDGRTALIVATSKGHLQCVELLLRYRANVQHMSRRKEGGTALHEAIFRQCNRRIVETLLTYGASPFVENISRFTPMDYAIVRRDAPLLRHLERHGYFSEYLRVRVLRTFGFSKGWAPKWVSIIPRYGCPLRPQQQTRRMLFIYNDSKGFDPMSKVYLDGATVRQVVGDTGQVQALLALHHTHAQPKALATNKDTAGQWIINFRAYNEGDQQVTKFINAVNTRQDTLIQALDGEDDAAFARRIQMYGSAENDFQAAQRPPTATSFSSVPEIRNQPFEHVVEEVHSQFINEAASEDPEEASAPPLPPEYYASTAEEVSNVPSHPTYDELGQDSQDVDDDGLCVVCLDKPKTCGFVHGSSMHRCVCPDCAKTVQESGDGLCPVCRQPIEHTITNFFF